MKIIVGTIHELSLHGFGDYAHLITTICLLSNHNVTGDRLRSEFPQAQLQHNLMTNDN